jgi:molybdopterin/thiamine biosynthesis adenylyltransferase
MDFTYEELYKRNIGILSEAEQTKIKDTKIAILGCGGGSETARQLVRTGFENFILADYDNVELHNLNRQFFFQKDVGRNKATALEENMRLINPHINCETLTIAVSDKNIPDIVERSDLIVDAIPPDTELKQELMIAREIRKYSNKYQLYFMDLVWGAKATVFSKDSPQTFEEFLGLATDCPLDDADKLTLEDLTRPYLEGASSEMLRVGKMMYEHTISYFPQMGTAIALAGSMTATLATFIAIGKDIKQAPTVFYIDYYKMFTQN